VPVGDDGVWALSPRIRDLGKITLYRTGSRAQAEAAFPHTGPLTHIDLARSRSVFPVVLLATLRTDAERALRDSLGWRLLDRRRSSRVCAGQPSFCWFVCRPCPVTTYGRPRAR
jgi:hypothetical protein